MNALIILFCFVSYLLGSIPTGLVMGKIFSNRDIRDSGSGNIGATNATRILGKKFGIPTFIGDMLKGFLPVYIGSQFFVSHLPLFTFNFVICIIGLAAFLGHLFPIYLKFKGGKGVATAFGFFLYLEPIAILIVIVLFMLIVALWRYVSLGSLTAAAAMPLVLVGLSFIKPVSLPNVLVSVVIGFLIFVKHKSNIQRLFHATESQIGTKRHL